MSISKKENLRYLYENVDTIADDPNRGGLLGILLYWKIFDGINIPDDLIKEILSKGTHPETIGRLNRYIKSESLSDSQNNKKGNKHD